MARIGREIARLLMTEGSVMLLIARFRVDGA